MSQEQNITGFFEDALTLLRSIAMADAVSAVYSVSYLPIMGMRYRYISPLRYGLSHYNIG